MAEVGKIVKGIAGFYYIFVENKGIYECKARGVFRKQNIKPLIGDNVEIDIIDEENKKGNLVKIKKRNRELIRPSVANITQAIVVFAANNPAPNLNLLDKFLIMIEKEDIDIILCFNKIDQVTDYDGFEDIVKAYKKTGYHVVCTSAKEDQGVEQLHEVLKNHTSVFAGPSGVGKSSLLNLIQDEVALETGEISEKIKRGKHTTRHAELIHYCENSYVVDTPGFSSINIEHIDKEDLKNYFIEFQPYEDMCKFYGCNHLSEPNCEVKRALEDDEIAKSRYENYKMIYEELKDIRRKW